LPLCFKHMLHLTLPEYLRNVVAAYPHHGINYIQDDSSVEFQYYPELLKEATSKAGGLLSLGLKPGNKAIIATAQNRQTITLLWACFLSGVVPTILQPPVTFTDYNPAASKLLNVFRQLGNPLYSLQAQPKQPIPNFPVRLFTIRIFLWRMESRIPIFQWMTWHSSSILQEVLVNLRV